MITYEGFFSFFYKIVKILRLFFLGHYALTELGGRCRESQGQGDVMNYDDCKHAGLYLGLKSYCCFIIYHIESWF